MAKHACPQRPAVRRVHSTPLRTAPTPRTCAPVSARVCRHLAPFSRNARIAEAPSRSYFPTLRYAHDSVFGLHPRIVRSLSTEPSAPAAENKPAAEEQLQAKPAAISPDSTVLKTASDGSESSNKKPTDDAGTAAPASRSLFSRFLELIRDNKGTIWMVILINFIIWLNSFMLGILSAKHGHMV